ncbi:MAG: hypothetical protein CBE43_01915 [Rhodopirellula sp. TMED283]|nr:MAG: hypothetical protein CBE43_01915 [Rhodopirellula sp. TMED283]
MGDTTPADPRITAAISTVVLINSLFKPIEKRSKKQDSARSMFNRNIRFISRPYAHANHPRFDTDCSSGSRARETNPTNPSITYLNDQRLKAVESKPPNTPALKEKV